MQVHLFYTEKGNYYMKLQPEVMKNYDGLTSAKFQVFLDDNTTADVTVLKQTTAQMRLDILQTMGGLIAKLSEEQQKLEHIDITLFSIAMLIVMTDIDFPTEIDEILQWYVWLIDRDVVENVVRLIPSKTLEELNTFTNAFVEFSQMENGGVDNEQESGENQ